MVFALTQSNESDRCTRMPLTVLFNGCTKYFSAPPDGTTSADVKEMIVGAFDHCVADGTFSLRSLDGRTASVFHAALDGNWELVLIPCEFGWEPSYVFVGP